jgi:hypothetical protein
MPAPSRDARRLFCKAFSGSAEMRGLQFCKAGLAVTLHVRMEPRRRARHSAGIEAATDPEMNDVAHLEQRRLALVTALARLAADPGFAGLSTIPGALIDASSASAAAATGAGTCPIIE